MGNGGNRNGITSPDKLMVLIGMVSMAFGSYLTLQRDDTDELRQAVGIQARQIAVLEYQVKAMLERDLERERRRVE